MSPHSDEQAGFRPEAYRAVFRASPDGIVITDREGRIRDVNPRAETLFGYEADEMLGEPVEMLVPEGARSDHRARRKEYATAPSRRPMGVGLELQGRRKDGTVFPVEISLSPCRVDDEELIVATVRDMTERRRLRRFGAGTLQAAEEERRRLARELHDDTAQRLAAALLRIQVVRRSMDDAEGLRALDELRSELLDTAEGVRRIARGLRPPALEDVGLLAAVRGHVRSTARAARAEVVLEEEIGGGVLDRMEDEEKLVLYRVIQEALSNAVRHADAEAVRVRLFVHEEHLVAEVEDDGGGFDPEDPGVDDAGLGLIGMRERTATVGGRFRIESEAGRGTLVRVEIPFAEEGAVHV